MQKQHIGSNSTHQDGKRAADTSMRADVPSTLALHRSNYVSAPASDTSGELEPDERYECAICIQWLNEPVLTSCGHLFCKSCLNSWLRKNNHCPLDNKKLIPEKDIFPDKNTQRLIEQIKFKCPNSPLGCEVIASPIEVDRHLPTCPYRRRDEMRDEKCPFASLKCDFVGRPGTNGVEEHIKEDVTHHMHLLLQAVQENVIATWQPHKSNGTTAENGHALPPPPPQYANEADEQLIQAMYQRIVVLEQQSREKDVKIENLTKQLTTVRQQVDPRYSNGTILWEVTNFHDLVKHLRANANNQVYSRECYTSPYGYKFCARLNIQPKKTQTLSLHVHLMQSENDYHLEWPFKGRIKLCMVHPRNANLSQVDTIMTKPEILAFHQPRERISTRGFGFVEYANIADIMHKGFCEDDRLVIKIQINIV